MKLTIALVLALFPGLFMFLLISGCAGHRPTPRPSPRVVYRDGSETTGKAWACTQDPTGSLQCIDMDLFIGAASAASLQPGVVHQL